MIKKTFNKHIIFDENIESSDEELNKKDDLLSNKSNNSDDSKRNNSKKLKTNSNTSSQQLNIEIQKKFQNFKIPVLKTSKEIQEEKEAEVIEIATKIANKKTIEFLLTTDKRKKETSFGFQIKGDCKIKGKNIIDEISPQSPASRAGLRINDKIIQINGISVENLTINSLIEQMSHEVKLNPFKLKLKIVRGDDDDDDDESRKRSFDCKLKNDNNCKQWCSALEKYRQKRKNFFLINPNKRHLDINIYILLTFR
jgi:C-terminal processing protease CtpA/Prc